MWIRRRNNKLRRYATSLWNRGVHTGRILYLCSRRFSLPFDVVEEILMDSL